MPSKWDDEDDDDAGLGCLLWAVLFILIFLFVWTARGADVLRWPF